MAKYLDSAPAATSWQKGLPETLSRFRVSRVLKGKLDKDIVSIQTPNPPVGADVKGLAGKDWILMLSPEFLAGKRPYADLSTIKDEPRVLSLLAAERKDQ